MPRQKRVKPENPKPRVASRFTVELNDQETQALEALTDLLQTGKKTFSARPCGCITA